MKINLSKIRKPARPQWVYPQKHEYKTAAEYIKLWDKCNALKSGATKIGDLWV